MKKIILIIKLPHAWVIDTTYAVVRYKLRYMYTHTRIYIHICTCMRALALNDVADLELNRMAIGNQQPATSNATIIQ